MIRAIGIDAVEINRFVSWSTYSRKRLSRIFSESELLYSFSVPTDTAQRLAVRFAARESFFKALTTLDSTHTIPFLSVCRHIAVEKMASGAIMLRVDWNALYRAGLAVAETNPIVYISATHTATTAFVVVILEAL